MLLVFVEEVKREKDTLTEIFDQTTYEEYESCLEDDNLPECDHKDSSEEEGKEKTPIQSILLVIRLSVIHYLWLKTNNFFILNAHKNIVLKN